MTVGPGDTSLFFFLFACVAISIISMDQSGISFWILIWNIASIQDGACDAHLLELNPTPVHQFLFTFTPFAHVEWPCVRTA